LFKEICGEKRAPPVSNVKLVKKLAKQTGQTSQVCKNQLRRFSARALSPPSSKKVNKRKFQNFDV
jgi:hypothetical protein